MAVTKIRKISSWTLLISSIISIIVDRKSTRLNSSHIEESRMPSSA